MKVAVTSAGEGLDALMDERLGRCPYFVILDTETGAIESLLNTAAEASSGAGTKAMQLLLDRDVQAIITGKIGPNAATLIEEAEMESLTERKGTVRQVLDEFRRDRGL
jgi:predicted Fe-Mo cluster-binding NifX family protein